MDPAVRFDDVTKTFGDVVANDGISFAVDRGSVHAVLGENGAGKTTLMNVLYGLYEPDAGTVAVDGSPRSFDSPREAIDAGVGMIHQHFKLVGTMTVAKNVVLGYEPREFFSLFTDERAAVEAVADLAETYGFDVDPTARISEIGIGSRQRVEILKALYRGADVLILDEPTAVLTPQEVDHLFSVFEDLLADGKTIIFITHKIGEALSVADEITVLRDGRRIETLDAAETDRDRLASLMVGRDVDLSTDRATREFGDPLLRVADLVTSTASTAESLDGLDFRVHGGEIFGVVGVDGNGQESLIGALVGTHPVTGGTIRYRDRDITDQARTDRHLDDFAYIPSDRQGEGLVMDFTLTENAILGEQRQERFAEGPRVRWDRARSYAESVIEEYDVDPSDPEAKARSLSGGNQQKFLVGRELLADPDFVVASNPTRGVDIGSVEFIHDRLLEMRAKGNGVLLISSKLEEVRDLADRVAVLYEGSFVDVVDPETTSDREFGLMMAGEWPSASDVTTSAEAD